MSIQLLDVRVTNNERPPPPFLKWFTNFMQSVKMATIRGLTFVFLWYASIIWSVFFLYCPLVPIVFFSRKWFRKCTDIILACWEMYPAALLEILIGCRIYISGDSIDPSEGSIIIMNHRNRLDWFFLWAALLHGTKPPCHRCKFVLKSGVKEIPGIGWGLQLAGFLFIHRVWEKDQQLLCRSLDYFKDLENTYQILIFPEGTDLCDLTKEKSNAFAAKQGLKPYEYVLHPRTTGFTFLVTRMKQNSQIRAIYDMTIGYPKTLPHCETDIIHGKIPEEVHFQIKRHDLSTLPNDEPGLKAWCEKRWEEKELQLEKFYKSPENEKKFSSKPISETPWNAMYFVLWAWSFWTFFTIYLTFTNWIAFTWVIFCTLSFIIISHYTDGIQQLEISLHRYLSDRNKKDTNGPPTHPIDNKRNADFSLGSGDHKVD